MRNIKQTYSIANSIMFIYYGSILHWHMPPSKINHFSATLDMIIM